MSKRLDIYRETLKSLLVSILHKFPNMGYCQGMNFLGAFLLCFCNLNSAFNIFVNFL